MDDVGEDANDQDMADEVSDLGDEADSPPLTEVPEGFTEVDPLADDVGQDAGESSDADEANSLLTDAQIDTAVGELGNIAEIQPEVWETLDADERLATLQGIEERMAEIQGRPPTELSSAPLEPGTCGGYTRGEGITLSEEHLGSNDVAEIVDTVVHEGRHAYQDHVIQNPDASHNQVLSQSWSENWDNYLTAEDYGQEVYQGQPIEADAWNYAGRVREQLFGRRGT